ncbi:lipopolysaccharide-binding protein-like [Carassius gibelio]|uniref:lipopolysaccharide-binding protein-like n=1 Tax=Carassius gibelio TaxID=101364 RepID=UPI002277FF99|nr:lipopolysaccharide-binding protein-like [Carassius gibelio]
MENKDQTGTEEVEYSFKGMKIKFDDFKSKQNFVSGTGISIAVQIPNLYVSGIMIFGPVTLSEVLVKTLSISATVAIKSDETGYPILSMDECSLKAESYELQDRAIVNIGISQIKKLLDIYLKRKICPALKTHLNDLNKQLWCYTLKATVSEYAEFDYSLMSADISANSIEMGLKGVFNNTQQHIETPSPPPAFSLASQSTTNMFYIAVSAFTINSAFMVLHKTNVSNIRITDEMVPSVSPIRLSTTTFGAFIPQISETHPDLKLDLKVKTVKEPIIKFEQDHVILQLQSKVTAYDVQSDDTPHKLFVLDLESVASVKITVEKGVLVFDLTLEKIEGSMNGKPFKQFKKNDFLTVIMHDIVFPIIKAHLAKGFQLPGLLGSYIGKVHVINPQVKVLKDYVLIGADIQFGENTSS